MLPILTGPAGGWAALFPVPEASSRIRNPQTLMRVFAAPSLELFRAQLHY
jgi:hypothetical protein